VLDREVLEENYGGEPLDGVVPRKHGDQVKAMKKFTRARMLVYVRETAIDQVLAPVTREDLPLDLSTPMFDWWLKISGSPLPQDGDLMRNMPRWRRRDMRTSRTCS